MGVSVMDDRSGLLEKESVAFVVEQERPSVRPNYSNFNQTAAINAKRPEMDELLEKTLLNVKLDESLTEREAEILKLIAAGNTNKKIAQLLGRTERTVEYHRHRLMHKLGVKSTARLVKRAIDMGIV